MSLSLFNKKIGNREYSYTFNAEKPSVIKEIQYFVDEKYTKTPLFIGSISKKGFVLVKTKVSFKIPLDFSYKVFGLLEKRNENCNIIYRITLANYFIKHLSVCVIPTLILFYVFSHYANLYLFVPIIYFFISDIIFNLRKSFLNRRSNNHFKFFLKKIEDSLQN